MATMEDLPTELIDHLCRFVDRSSLKSFRLLCKTYADVAQKHLFHNLEFHLYPSSRRFYQLEQLASNKSIAPYLRGISFQSGVPLEYADYRYWQAQVYHDISSAWSRDNAANGLSKSDYSQFHESLQARFPPDFSSRYDLYRWHLDQQAAAMADQRVRDSLIRTLNSLSHSTSDVKFRIIMSEPQIRLEELEDFDPEEYAMDRPFDPDARRRVYNRRKNCLSQFTNFLEAAHASRCPLIHLVAVDLPHEMLHRPRHNQESILDDIFAHLKTLNLKIGSLPHSDQLSREGLNDQVYARGRNQSAWRLKSLLNKATELEELTLELLHGKEAEYSFELFDRTNIDRFPQLWVPHLKSLSLSRFHCRWGDLKALLDQGVNIRGLTLRDCRMETRSMLDVLQYLSKRRFDSISVLGTWQVDEDQGEWHWHSPDDFTSCSAATSYEGPYAIAGMKSTLENYMLSGGECPLPVWTTTNRAEDTWEMLGDTSFHYLPGPLRT
ncbi:hypothetical protein LTR84_010891 [Exophiala bonariae]|uniref:F-box domain-containing protein n=1 Tax=Exophiala bonariae TaxID=1690606 RepID=A0AAV9NI23_9EURO|nr:hypothetical protein LTR84_010891 [Exophiala bonariae]